MPLIRTGAGVTNISGSISGNTFARNKSGLCMRTRTVPTNPQSSAQSKARSLFCQLTQVWRSGLSDSQRSAWNNYAAVIVSKNKLGESTNFTGQLHFIRSNQARMTAGLALQKDGPTSLLLPEKDPTFSFVAFATSQEIYLSFDHSLPWFSEPGGALSLLIGRPVSMTRNYFNGPWRYSGCILASAADPQILASPFVLMAGQKIFASAKIVRADGRLSNNFSACYIEVPFLRENFNLYNDGALNGQGGWSGDLNFLIQGDTTYEGAKALKITAAGTLFMSKTCPLVESGECSVMLRKDTSRGSGTTMHRFTQDDTDSNEVCCVQMYGNDISYRSANVNHVLLPNYELGRWYKLTMQWVGSPSYKVRYKLDDDAWTSWVTRSYSVSISPAWRCHLVIDALSGGATAYYDDIK